MRVILKKLAFSERQPLIPDKLLQATKRFKIIFVIREKKITAKRRRKKNDHLHACSKTPRYANTKALLGPESFCLKRKSISHSSLYRILDTKTCCRIGNTDGRGEGGGGGGVGSICLHGL